MIDSLTHWVTEYKIDGFRFDLMGIHDVDTMNEIREAMDAIDPRILLLWRRLGYGDRFGSKG